MSTLSHPCSSGLPYFKSFLQILCRKAWKPLSLVKQFVCFALAGWCHIRLWSLAFLNCWSECLTFSFRWKPSRVSAQLVCSDPPTGRPERCRSLFHHSLVQSASSLLLKKHIVVKYSSAASFTAVCICWSSFLITPEVAAFYGNWTLCWFQSNVLTSTQLSVCTPSWKY